MDLIYVGDYIEVMRIASARAAITRSRNAVAASRASVSRSRILIKVSQQLIARADGFPLKVPADLADEQEGSCSWAWQAILDQRAINREMRVTLSVRWILAEQPPGLHA